MGDSSLVPKNSLLLTGPPLVGIALNWWLWGILTMQYCLYLNSSQAKKDKRVVRGIVHFLFLLDAAQSILAMVDAFHWFVYNFGNYDALHDVEMSGIDGPLLDSIIALIVQFTYCWRIWVLSRQRGLLRTLLPTIIALLALASCVGGSMRGIEGSVVKRTPGVSGVTGHLDKFETILWNAAGSAADVLIALSMAYLLLSFGTENTDRGFLRKVRLIVIFTLETNLLTTILAIVNMVVVVIKPIGPPVTTLFLAPGYPLAKLYSNCFMVLLNQRTYHDTSESIQTNKSISKSQSLPVAPTWGNSSSSIVFASPHSGSHVKSGRSDTLVLT